MNNKEVLLPTEISEEGKKLRKKQERTIFFKAVVSAFLLYILMFLVFFLSGKWRVQELGMYSGPVLVKIGIPSAPESDIPDNPVKKSETENTVNKPETETQKKQAEDSSNIKQQEQNKEEEKVPEQIPQEPETPENTGETAEEITESVPSRVMGEENGNSYLLDFDGSAAEVGRAGRKNGILYYLPLPQVVPSGLFKDARERYSSLPEDNKTTRNNPDFIAGELLEYWEEDPVSGDFIKRRPLPMEDRPYYWSLLTRGLGVDILSSDWHFTGIRPVQAEFTVRPSDGIYGADLTDIKITKSSGNPDVDKAVIYGLQKWTYYNDTEKPIRARITYSFK